MWLLGQRPDQIPDSDSVSYAEVQPDRSVAGANRLHKEVRCCCPSSDAVGRHSGAVLDVSWCSGAREGP